MQKLCRSALIVALLSVALVACNQKEKAGEGDEPFSFVVYPGAQYLPHLTEMTKQAHKVLAPQTDPPPTAIYDTDASVEDVAGFYAKSYGYGTVAPDTTNNLSAAKPPAYYRSGDLQTDAQGIVSTLQKMKLNTDTTKAQGLYKAAEIDPKVNRPRVTIQRPYFDVTTSKVINKTLILMSR